MAERLYPVYYDSRKQFRKHFDAGSGRMGFDAATPAAWKSWAKRARVRLVEILGLDRLQPATPKARMTGRVDCGEYIREHWLMRTQPEVTMPFYVLSPKGATGPLPAVFCPHGHGGGGKAAVAGVHINSDVTAAIAKYNYAYGLEFARAGFRVFCPDARGFGERQEKEVRGSPLAGSCHHLQLMGAGLGIPVIGMWVFDLMRLADYALSRKDVLSDRLGCAGLSGGGYQTLFFSAADPRVTCAVVSGYFYGVRDSLLELPGNCDCNVVPHLWENFDMGDVGAMIAPRPLMIETGDQDPLNGANGMKNVRSQVKIAGQAYKLLKATGQLANSIFPGQHRWNGVEAVPWMKRWLGDRE